MSTENMNQTNGASAIEAFFQHVEASGPQPRLRNVTGVCKLNIQGAGTWWASIKKGVITVTKGEGRDMPPPNCTISCSADDFLRIMKRKDNLNVYAAALQEILTVDGDIPFAWTILGSFVINPAEAITR